MRLSFVRDRAVEYIKSINVQGYSRRSSRMIPSSMMWAEYGYINTTKAGIWMI